MINNGIFAKSLFFCAVLARKEIAQTKDPFNSSSNPGKTQEIISRKLENANSYSKVISSV